MSAIREKENIVNIQTGWVLLEISGGGCASCEALYPVLKEIEEQIDGLKVVRIEAEALTEEWLKERNILRLPTCLLLYNGEEKGRFHGFQPTEILEIWLESKMQAD